MSKKERYFGFIYKWTDSSNKKTYIGSHYGSVINGYIGSGKLFLDAYHKRPEKFTREILEYIFEDSKKMILKEKQKYIDKINWNNTYNNKDKNE